MVSIETYNMVAYSAFFLLFLIGLFGFLSKKFIAGDLGFYGFRGDFISKEKRELDFSSLAKRNPILILIIFFILFPLSILFSIILLKLQLFPVDSFSFTIFGVFLLVLVFSTYLSPQIYLYYIQKDLLKVKGFILTQKKSINPCWFGSILSGLSVFYLFLVLLYQVDLDILNIVIVFVFFAESYYNFMEFAESLERETNGRIKKIQMFFFLFFLFPIGIYLLQKKLNELN